MNSDIVPPPLSVFEMPQEPGEAFNIRDKCRKHLKAILGSSVSAIIVAVVITVLVVLGRNGILTKKPQDSKETPNIPIDFVLKYLKSDTTLKPSHQPAIAPESTGPFCGDPFYKPKIILNSNGRILNGVDAAPNSQPWLVSLRYVFPNGQISTHICGGALISDQHVLTAGHCVDKYDASSLVVVSGLHYINALELQNVYYIESVFIHENYSRSNGIKNDIALLKLNRKLIQSNKVSTICLPPDSKDEFLIGKDVLVSGWGNTLSGYKSNVAETLKSVKLTIENSNPICTYNGVSYNELKFCAYDYDTNGNSNICFGDSGSPLVAQQPGSESWFIYGVTSYVLADVDQYGRRRCLIDRPSYYTRVAKYLDWILNKLSL